MKNKRKLHEDHALSCRYLQDRIWNETDSRKRPLLLEDLATKVHMLGEDSPIMRISPDKKEPVDIIVFTVTDTELPAVKIALDIDPLVREDDNPHGIRIWKRKIQQTDPKRDVSLMLVFIGEQTNHASGVACTAIFSKYHPHTAVLIGVAAGVKKKVKLLDVVAATEIIYYEHQSLHPEGPQKRPIPYPLDPVMKRNLSNYFPDAHSWHKTFKTTLRKLKKFNKTLKKTRVYNPRFERGVILSGEKLIRDGTLPELAKDYHDKTMAAEEEAGGFCKACEEHNIPWLVFRGISDFGDPSKTKKVQSMAALAAATAAATFLKTDFRFPYELETF